MEEKEGKMSASGAEAVRVATKVTWVGFFTNALLGAAKIVAGVAGRSSALIADGVHSFSDFASDIVVLLMVNVARHKPDKSHPFGHGKFETLATVILATLLIAVAGGIFWEGLMNVIKAFKGEETPRPGLIALIICLVSILSKEWLYHYTRRAGERIKSEAVIANAWHHRSDAFSSVATLLGILGAYCLGPGWHFLDPLAAMIVAIFIAGVGVKLALPATRELLGAPLSEEKIGEIKKAIVSVPGVVTYHHLRTAKSGADCIIEFHLKVNPDITVREAHAIATRVEERIKRAMDSDHSFVNIHIEPYSDEDILPDGSCQD